MFIVPAGVADDSNFLFYNQGKELWRGAGGDMRDDIEDKFRH